MVQRPEWKQDLDGKRVESSYLNSRDTGKLMATQYPDLTAGGPISDWRNDASKKRPQSVLAPVIPRINRYCLGPTQLYGGGARLSRAPAPRQNPLVTRYMQPAVDNQPDNGPASTNVLLDKGP